MSPELDVLLQEPSRDELARRRAVAAEIRALREQIPPIAPLTAADLVHMGREDSCCFGDEATVNESGH